MRQDGFEGGGSLKEGKKGTRLDKGGFPLDRAAAQYQEWVYDQLPTWPALLDPFTKDEKENNSLKGTVHGQCRTTGNESDDQCDMGTKEPCDVPTVP